MIRTLGAEDAQRFQAFVRRLSPASRRQRFHTGLNELYPELLAQLTRTGGQGHAAFVAVAKADGRDVIIGEARYAPSMEHAGATEFAVAVADDWQNIGLGTALIGRLVSEACRAGTTRLYGDIQQENTGMLRLAKRLGFRPGSHPDGAWLARVTLDLRAARTGAAALQPAAATLARRSTAGSRPAAISA